MIMFKNRIKEYEKTLKHKIDTDNTNAISRLQDEETKCKEMMSNYF
jgi:hypothetical protein